MDTLIVHAAAGTAEKFDVHWTWSRANQDTPMGGLLRVSVDPSWTLDRRALAEVGAIHYLLQEQQVHGMNRLGAGIAIGVGEKVIVQALQKRALKKTGSGTAGASPIIQAVEFLATKFFEADVSLAKWMEPPAYKSFLESEITVGSDLPSAVIDCRIIGGSIRITRHAMHNYVARVDQKLHKLDEDDLSNVPSARWTAAWKWLVRVLAHPHLEEAVLNEKALSRPKPEYGEGTRYLRFPDAGDVIFVVRFDARGALLATVFHEDPYTSFLERVPFMHGQQLMKHSVAMIKRAGRN